MIEKLRGLSANLSTWSLLLNQDLKEKITGFENQIDHMRGKTNPVSIFQLSNLLAQKEAFWKQRSKQFLL